MPKPKRESIQPIHPDVRTFDNLEAVGAVRYDELIPEDISSPSNEEVASISSATSRSAEQVAHQTVLTFPPNELKPSGSELPTDRAIERCISDQNFDRLSPGRLSDLRLSSASQLGSVLSSPAHRTNNLDIGSSIVAPLGNFYQRRFRAPQVTDRDQLLDLLEPTLSNDVSEQQLEVITDHLIEILDIMRLFLYPKIRFPSFQKWAQTISQKVTQNEVVFTNNPYLNSRHLVALQEIMQLSPEIVQVLFNVLNQRYMMYRDLDPDLVPEDSADITSDELVDSINKIIPSVLPDQLLMAPSILQSEIESFKSASRTITFAQLEEFNIQAQRKLATIPRFVRAISSNSDFEAYTTRIVARALEQNNIIIEPSDIFEQANLEGILDQKIRELTQNRGNLDLLSPSDVEALAGTLALEIEVYFIQNNLARALSDRQKSAIYDQSVELVTRDTRVVNLDRETGFSQSIRLAMRRIHQEGAISNFDIQSLVEEGIGQYEAIQDSHLHLPPLDNTNSATIARIFEEIILREARRGRIQRIEDIYSLDIYIAHTRNLIETQGSSFGFITEEQLDSFCADSYLFNSLYCDVSLTPAQKDKILSVARRLIVQICSDLDVPIRHSVMEPSSQHNLNFDIGPDSGELSSLFSDPDELEQLTGPADDIFRFNVASDDDYFQAPQEPLNTTTPDLIAVSSPEVYEDESPTIPELPRVGINTSPSSDESNFVAEGPTIPPTVDDEYEVLFDEPEPLAPTPITTPPKPVAPSIPAPGISEPVSALEETVVGTEINDEDEVFFDEPEPITRPSTPPPPAPAPKPDFSTASSLASKSARYAMYDDLPMAVIGAGVTANETSMPTLHSSIASAPTTPPSETSGWDDFWAGLKDRISAEPEYTAFPEQFDPEKYTIRPMELVTNFDQANPDLAAARERAAQTYLRDHSPLPTFEATYVVPSATPELARDETPPAIAKVRVDAAEETGDTPIPSLDLSRPGRTTTPTSTRTVGTSHTVETPSGDSYYDARMIEMYQDQLEEGYQMIGAGANVSPFMKVTSSPKEEKKGFFSRFKFWGNKEAA